MNTHDENSSKSTKALRVWLTFGALICMISVLVGAFASHGLKASLSDYQLGIIDTAAKYQMYHGLAVLIASTLFLVMGTFKKSIHIVNSAFALGCIFFSGSLYCLAITDIKVFAYFTPLGGLSFILGWCLLIWAIFTSPKQLMSTK